MKVWIVEVNSAWSDYYEIVEVWGSEEKAYESAAKIVLDHWSPGDDEEWHDEIEKTGKYISKSEWAKKYIETDDWWVRVGEWDVN